MTTTNAFGGGSPEPARINVHGDFTSTTGLMEVGRRLTRALSGEQFDLRAHDIVIRGAPHSTTRTDPALDQLSRELHPVGTDLWLANINEFPAIGDEELRPPGCRRRVVGLWFWEVSALPEVLIHQLDRVDEIWVASTFVRDTLSSYTEKPIHVVPLPIELPLPDTFTRGDYGLPDGKLVFLFAFDPNSVIERKNPLAVVESFAAAFAGAGRDEVHLAVKTDHLERYPAFTDVLHPAVDGVGGTLLADDLTRLEMNALIASADVYVSLHRSEGFGLGMAEAMSLGKPVIATAYSGNRDFTTATNSCPVGYRLRAITDEDHRWFPAAATVYLPHVARWAEPDLAAASEWMRLLHALPDVRQRIGSAGADTIGSRYTAEATRRAVAELVAA